MENTRKENKLLTLENENLRKKTLDAEREAIAAKESEDDIKKKLDDKLFLGKFLCLNCCIVGSCVDSCLRHPRMLGLQVGWGQPP